MRLDTRPHLGLLTAAAVLAIAPWSLAACGNEGDPVPPAKNSAPATPPTTQSDEQDVRGAQDYFADDSHRGEQVSVNASVDLNLNKHALVLHADDYGDDSLLVILEQETQNFSEGDVVTVTGTVKKFSYERYRDKYGLVQSAIYDGYANEQFLLGKSVTAAENAPAG